MGIFDFLKKATAGEMQVNKAGQKSASLRLQELEQVRGLRNQKKYQQAIDLLEEILRSEPENAGYWGLKGSSLTELRKYSEALSCFEKSTSLSPQAPEWWALKGDVLVSLNRLQEAGDAYKQYLSVASPEDDANGVAIVKGILASLHDPIKLLQERNSLMETRKYEQALARFDCALQVLPLNTEKEVGLACALCASKSEACEKLRKWEDVLVCWNKILEIGPALTKEWPTWASIAWFKKALALQMLKRNEEALICYDNALEANPSAEHASSIRNNRESVLASIRVQKGDGC